MKLQTTCKQLDTTDFIKIMVLDVALLLIQFMLLIIVWA